MAQTATATTATPAAAAPAASAPSTAELQALVDTLQDEKARTALVGQLQTLIAAQRTTSNAPVEPADLVARFTQYLNALAEELLAGVAIVLDAPRLLAWANFQVSDDTARTRWGQVFVACIVVFGLAAIAEWLLRRAFARIGQREPTSPPDGAKPEWRGMRLMHAALGVLVEALPVVAFGAGAFVAMAIILPPYSTGRGSSPPSNSARTPLRAISHT